jgi:two-component system nitrogen regulation sensor histidine kinase NtrY
LILTICATPRTFSLRWLIILLAQGTYPSATAARTDILLFARTQRLLATNLAQRDIRMSASVEPQSLELAMDAELLDQAPINRVRNSIEALSDTPAATIGLAAHRESDGRIVIAVADNGPGIAAEDREKVFVPFFTAKRQGSGIGLTLVR